MPIPSDSAPIDAIAQLVETNTGETLSDLQQLILEKCWQPGKKTYEEIAASTNYSNKYLQQRVAPDLWKLLSEATGTKIYKSNFRKELTRYFHSRPPTTKTASTLSLPGESLPLDSPFYIERQPHERVCSEALLRPGALIRIKAPRQMGKTSLMHRLIARVPDYRCVIVDFHQCDRAALTNLGTLLRWLMANMTHQLQITSAIGDYWDTDIGHKMSCTMYLEEHLLAQMHQPLVLILENVSQLFSYPDIAKDFFAMLRAWHEYTKHNATWHNLRLILIQSTETYLPLKINQSPFNVGIEAALTPFSPQETQTLAQRYGINHVNDTCSRLLDLVGGHPYLTQQIFHAITHQAQTCADILANATNDTSLFHAHLHRLLWILDQQPDLAQSFYKVLSSEAPVLLPQPQSFKLKSLGLVTLEHNQARVNCKLYEQYFSRHIKDNN